MGQLQSKGILRGLGFTPGHLGDEELEKKIQHLRDTALKKIDDYTTKYGLGSVVNNEEIELFLQEIKNKLILVAVVGEVSSGKSTLINAFLRDRLLPSAVGKVTDVRVFIGHDPNVHPGPCDEANGPTCDNCPYLVNGFKGIIICHGIKNIQAKLKELNKTPNRYPEPLVLYTFIPVFASLGSSNHCTPYLVDSPGVEKIKKDVHSYYSVLSAMIYVENYSRLLHNKENIKEELALMPDNASLFFIVSHFDSYFTSSSDEENPDEEGIKDKVTQSFNNVASDSIFPVCGLWALNAHLTLKYHEDDTDIVNWAYSKCTENVLDVDLNEKATHVLNVTAFEQMEEKLKESVRATDFRQWNINIYNQCQKLLKDPIRAGKTILQELETKMNCMKETIKDLNSKIEVLKTLEDHLEGYISNGGLEQSLQEKSASFVREKLSPKVNEELNTFFSSCKDNVRQGYNFGQFLTDLEIFKEHTLTDTVIKVVNDEVKRYAEVLQLELKELYITLLSHIEKSSSYQEAHEGDSDRLDGYSFGEPSKRIKDFFKDKTSTEKMKNAAFGVVSGAGGFIVPAAVAIGKSIFSYIFVASLSVPALGLLGFTYFILKMWNTTDADMKLNKTDIERLHNELALDIKKDYKDIKKKLDGAVLNTIRNYNKSLREEYNEKWKWKLTTQLKEDEDSLKCLCSEQDEFKKALKELEECDSFLEELLEKTEEID